MLINRTILKHTVHTLVALCIFTSCRSVYTFEALTPTAYTLPQNLDTILVVNTCPARIWTDTSKYDNKYAIGIVSSEKSLPKLIGSIMSNKLNQDGYIPSKVYSKSILLDSLKIKADSLCRAYNTNCILALKHVDYQFLTTGEKYYDYDNIEKISLTDKFVINALWTLMSPSGYCQDFELLTDSLAETNQLYPMEIRSFIPAPRQRTYVAAQLSCDKLSSLITPSWRTNTRYIFFSQKEKFTQALNAIDNKQWNEAKSVFYMIYETDRKRNKIRAALDLSLSYEIEDDIEAALIWLFKAQDLLNNTRGMKFEKEYANKLLALLKKRQVEIRKLDKQMRKI